MSNQPPIEVPQGAIRLNTDSQKLEFFAQDRWYEFATHVTGENLQGGQGRGFVLQGINPSIVSDVSYVDINTGGGGYDFGDATTSRRGPAGAGSRTRALSAGGCTPSVQDNIDFFTFSSTGNGTDFGNMSTGNRSALCGMGNQTRALFCGGYTPSVSDTIDAITFASTGSSFDFGNLSVGRWDPAGFSSPTRGVIANGTAVAAGNSVSNVIDFVTLSSSGNAQDFGDATQVKQACPGCSNSIRGCWGGGYTPSSTKNIDTITIATRGDATDFGDLTQTLTVGGAFGSPVRGVWAAGYSGGNSNTINYIAFATKGDAVDYGDLNRSTHRNGSCSNSHGGV